MIFCAMLFYAILCYYYSLLFYSMLFYAVLFYAMLFYVMLFYATLCYAILCYAILYYAILCYAILCNAILCYVNKISYPNSPLYLNVISQSINMLMQMIIDFTTATYSVARRVFSSTIVSSEPASFTLCIELDAL